MIGLSTFLSNIPLFLLPVAQLEENSSEYLFKEFFQKLRPIKGLSFLFGLNFLDPNFSTLSKRISARSLGLAQFQATSNIFLNNFSTIYTLITLCYVFWYAASNLISVLVLFVIFLIGFNSVFMGGWVLKALVNSGFLGNLECPKLVNSFLVTLLLTFSYFLTKIFYPEEVPLILFLIFLGLEFLRLLVSLFSKEVYELDLTQSLIFGVGLSFNYTQFAFKFSQNFFKNFFNLQNFFKPLNDLNLIFLNGSYHLLLWSGWVIISLKILLVLFYLLLLGFCYTLDFFKAPFRTFFMVPEDESTGVSKESKRVKSQIVPKECQIVPEERKRVTFRI